MTLNLFSTKHPLPFSYAKAAEDREARENISENEILAWVRLSRTENVGPITFCKLMECYGSAHKAIAALPELSRRGGRKNPLVPPSETEVAREYEALKKMGGEFVVAADERYPTYLSAIDDAPPVISVLGNAGLLARSSIGIVGARNASLTGRKMAEKLARDLGQREQVIVSGLARGIDTAAHRGSLATGTVAVVAGGIDVVYPEENQKLYEEIIEQGAVVAESKFGQKPFAASFPRRNRIISGLSKGLIVVEATMRSGSLITARLAGEHGREVYAVPGSPLDPRAAGPNHLIREGATLVRDADDVLEAMMDLTGKAVREDPAPALKYNSEGDKIANPEENLTEKARQDVLEQLSFTPIQVDELLRACHVTVSALQTILLELELAGRVKRLPGNRVSLLQEE